MIFSSFVDRDLLKKIEETRRFVNIFFMVVAIVQSLEQRYEENNSWMLTMLTRQPEKWRQ